MNRKHLRVSATAAVAALALALTGCGSGLSKNKGTADVKAGSIKANALKGKSIKVGSKDFDEQLVLGQITLLALKAAGAKVTDKTNISGSTATREALEKGDIDVYYDYTGTGYVNYLGHDKPIQDPTALYNAVKKEDLAKHKLYWGKPAPMNNTYAMAVTKEFAAKNHLKTLSDMASYGKSHPGSTACVESEFAGRPDGYPGMLKAYGIPANEFKEKKLGTGVVYTQLDKGACDFGEVFTTDGRIAALGLVPLQDDKKFFPLYNAAPIVSAKTEKSDPEILKVLEPISAKLTTQTMTELNKKKSADGENPSKIAQDWLKQEGFIK